MSEHASEWGRSPVEVERRLLKAVTLAAAVRGAGGSADYVRLTGDPHRDADAVRVRRDAERAAGMRRPASELTWTAAVRVLVTLDRFALAHV